MRIGLISDTHGDPVAFAKALSALGDLDLMLHAGDVLYHGVFNPIEETYDPRRLAEMLNEHSVPMVHARGNCDSEVDQLALDDCVLSELAFVSAEGTRILLCHGHRHSDEELGRMGARMGAHVVHRGHTHEPGIKRVEAVTLVNAGSCALPKQEDLTATAGLIEGGMIKIISVETGQEYVSGVIGG